jgi:hypothetical protein
MVIEYKGIDIYPTCGFNLGIMDSYRLHIVKEIVMNSTINLSAKEMWVMLKNMAYKYK